MDSIKYKGKEYPTRLFIVNNPEFGENQVIRIGNYSLNSDMGNIEDYGDEEFDVDDEIYYYVDDNELELSAVEICKNHLDVPMEFIEEISEEYLDK
jgi:hypothetical protein